MVDMISALKDTFESLTEDAETAEKLLELKKELAEEIAAKLAEQSWDLLISIGEEMVADYLVDEGLTDKLHDSFVGKGLETFGSQLTPKLQAAREKINKVKTEKELEILKSQIFAELWIQASELVSPEGQEQDADVKNSVLPTQTESLETADTANDTETPAPVVSNSPIPPVTSEHPTAKSLNIDISAGAEKLHESLKGKEKPSLEAFSMALQGYEKLKDKVKNPTYLTVVDFSKSNKTNRLYIINMATKTVEDALLTWHGKNSGDEFATDFSDKMGSKQSSLGFYRTPMEITKANTKNWRGLRMNGIEDSNDKASDRGIFIHPASVNGSEGCFTLPMSQAEANKIMNKIKGDSVLFAYYPDRDYLASSQFIDSKNISTRMAA